MNFIRYIGILIIAFASMPASAIFGQLEKANHYYDAYEYARAIPIYQKILKKDAGNTEATERLADCYRLLHDYQNAEIYYQKLVAMEAASDQNKIQYAQVLRMNNKQDDAKEVFVVFATKNAEAEAYTKAIEQVGEWNGEQAWFEVDPVQDINTSGSEFCSAFYNGGILYVSDQQRDFITQQRSGMTNHPYLSIYYAKTDGATGFKKGHLFSQRFDNNYHNGPITIDKAGDLAFFTRVELKRTKDRNFVNRPQLYYCTAKNGKWSKPIPFQHNNDDYALAHPALSADGNTLYFSSDMPGGRGGKDIYMCHREGDSWSKPENMGEMINTWGDEMFPYEKEDGTFYFASNGHAGYGGLDIFQVTRRKNGKLDELDNLRAPLNSPMDDFGICFKDDKTGYFSSNRVGGSGDDDIYSFKQVFVKEKPKTEITGVFMYSKLSAGPGVQLKLLDEDNVEIGRIATDENGEFKFDKLDPDRKYLVMLAEDDIKIGDQARIYLTNAKGERIKELLLENNSYFAFQSLPLDEYNALQPLKLEDASIMTIALSGQVYEKLPGDYPAGLEVYVLDDSGAILYVTKTDENGNFNFDKLPPDKNYIIRLKQEDAKAKIIITDDKGIPIDNASRMKNGNFVYERLTADKNIITLLDENDVVLKIDPNDNFVINNIYYDYGSAEINEDAAKELDKLYTILSKNKHIAVNLSSHTDSRSSADYNFKLSNERAQKAVEYLVNKGIDSSRIHGKGYGETMLKISDAEIAKMKTEEEKEAAHQKNRRTEFKIVTR